MKQAYAVSPPELSPAAQAVLDAFRSSHTGQGCLAAALRAAVKKAMPVVKSPWGASMNPVLTAMESRDLLLAIAAELDGATTTSEND
jgi:hypothetical protein